MIELLIFLISVSIISLSASIVPGPLTAILITKSYTDKFAGIFLLLGHLVIELPLLILIGLGMAPFFENKLLRILIPLLGGLMIVKMGYSLLKDKDKYNLHREENKKGIVIGGIVGTLSPYFFIWWITAGAALILKSFTFGATGFILLIAVHVLVDALWFQTLSSVIYKTKRFWTPQAHRLVFGACGVFLIFFGVYFLASIRL